MISRVRQIVLLAAGQSEEFAKARVDLHEAAEVIECDTPQAVERYLQEAQFAPELIVIAQSRPGQFCTAELDALIRLAPLARFIHLLGSWCEGESRTGRPWPGAKRIFWYDWPGEAARNLSRCSLDAGCSWSSPSTSLEEERWLLLEAPVSEKSANGIIQHKEDSLNHSHRVDPLVLVCTRRSSFGEAISIACRQEGFASFWLPPHVSAAIQGVGAILWEGVQLRSHEEEELMKLARLYPKVPILACADFPRLETQHRAIAAGAKTVLAKPLSIADIFWHLDQWLPKTKSVGSNSEQAA